MPINTIIAAIQFRLNSIEKNPTVGSKEENRLDMIKCRRPSGPVVLLFEIP